MSGQEANPPVPPTRGWFSTSFWETIRSVVPASIPPTSPSSGPNDQTSIDILHHLAASQPVFPREHEEPINLDLIRLDGLDNLTGQIKDKGAYADSIGGFSDVWKCFWVNKNQRVAVKAIRIQADNGDRERKCRRLCREAKIWATLKHAHILPFLGVTWGFGPLPALVCPWVENGHLNDYLELNHKNLTMERRFRILRGLILAVSYLHSHEVIHGDITGSNLLIGEDGEPLLADFGLSFLDMELTGNPYFTSCKPGAVRWAAPELLIQLKDGSPCRACVKSDVYSVGCVMLQVLSGRVPYYDTSNDYMVIFEKCKEAEPLPPCGAPIDDGHLEFMRRCWRRKEERNVTVEEIAAFINGELGY